MNLWDHQTKRNCKKNLKCTDYIQIQNLSQVFVFIVTVMSSFSQSSFTLYQAGLQGVRGSVGLMYK